MKRLHALPVLLLLLAAASHAQESSPLDDILGITEKEATSPEPAVSGPVKSVTGSDGQFDATVLVPPIFSGPEGVVRVVARNVDSATHYLNCTLVINYGEEYYPWFNEETVAVSPGEEKKLEIAYELRTLTDKTRARIILANLPEEKPRFPPDGIFLSVVLTPETAASPQVWRPEIHRRGALAFYVTPGMFTGEELEKLAESYEKAHEKVSQFWEQPLPEPISVYLFNEPSERDRFLLSKDEEVQYPDAIIDARVEGKFADPGERLSWMASVYVGDPPPLFHDAAALLMQENPNWRDRPLKEWARIEKEKKEFYPLARLLAYDSTNPKDATREIGIPQVASFCDYLLSVKDQGSFREAFMLMNRGDSEPTFNHNQEVLSSIYGEDIEALEKSWLEWVGRKGLPAPSEAVESATAGG